MKRISLVLAGILLLCGCGGPVKVTTHHMQNGDTCYTVQSRNGNPRGVSCTPEK